MDKSIKRIFDVFVSVIGIIILSPIWIIIAIAVKAESKGPIFYTHVRVGKNGKKFNCFKFRSMFEGVDPDSLVGSPGDFRLTKLGHIIRKTSLDEIPQLINVLLGDMSIVGPRPALPSQVEKFSKKELDKLLVKPGLTGWTQVNGRNAISYEKRMELDCWYAKNWNLFLDFKILLLTPFIVFRQKGIYDDKERRYL